MAKASAKDATVLITGSKFSTYATAYEVELNAGPVDVTGFGDGCTNFIPTIPTGKMSIDMFWEDTDTTGVNAKLVTLGSGIVTLIPETYSIGTACLSLPYTQANFSPQAAITDVIKIGSIEFNSYGNNYGVEPGIVLYSGTITNTTTSTTFDNGAATTAKYSAVVHVWTPTSTDSYAVKVQHSTNGSAWSDLLTFTANGQTITAERSAAATGVNQYRRIVATRTGAAAESFGLTVVLYSI